MMDETLIGEAAAYGATNTPPPTLGASRATPEEPAPSLLLSPQPGPMPAPAAEPAPPGDEEDEVLCRYCFEGPEAGELLSPCECKGGQKWVHLSCLRRWQRMVLVSQPTHPAFYERDPRHHECNVCKSKFTCPPPTYVADASLQAHAHAHASPQAHANTRAHASAHADAYTQPRSANQHPTPAPHPCTPPLPRRRHELMASFTGPELGASSYTLTL